MFILFAGFVRAWSITAAAAVLGAANPSDAFVSATVGGTEGELDINAHFIGEFGKIEPTERPTTFQSADIKIVNVGAGYTVGSLWALEDFYLRVDGYYFRAGEEVISDPADDAFLANGGPVPVFDADKGGYVTATVAANFVHEARYSFGAYLQGTVPIDVDFEKFSNVRLHWVGGGTTVGVYLTDPTKLFRLAYSGRIFVGSGAYDGDAQHNAAVAITNLFHVEAARPFRIGLAVGPYFEGDMVEHQNARYHELYRDISPDLVAGDRNRAMRFAVAVLPYFKFTQNIALELGYVQKLFGYDAVATQLYTAGVRTAF